MGARRAGGEKRRACHPPSAQRALSFFLFNTFSQPASYFQLMVCVRVCMHECFRARESECVLEVRFGAGTIKALLKHF